MKTAWEKFQSAIVCLARSGGIKDRLTDAYRNYLALVAEEELPKELREDFRSLGRALTRERPLLRGEDAFRATIRKMSNEEADQNRRRAIVMLMFAAIPRSYTPMIAFVRVRAGRAAVPCRSCRSVSFAPRRGRGRGVSRS